MGAFIVRRLLGMILVLVAVSIIVYLIFIVIPGGDPAIRIAGRTATQANIESIRRNLGLDQNFIVQWWDMLKQLFTGQLVSYSNQTNVVQQIKEGLPATFSLAVGAGIIVGTISAVTAGKASDRVITAGALIGISLPVAWLGLLLRYFLAGEGG